MITPLALIGLIGLPIIVAFYMLRLRRRDVPVGSTFLWQQLVRDVEANAPWQRLRFSWLLLLQLLIAAIVVAAAVRPFTASVSDLAANVVLIVDTSASMASHTTDEDRMAEARARARDVVGRMPDGGRITVVAAADSASVLVSETDDRDAALEAIEAIDATQLTGDLTDAFALASALAARDADSTVVVVTDASGDELPDVGVEAPVLVERVGATDANQAIAALSAVRRAGGAQLDLFVAVANPSTADATRRLEVRADGELVEARDLAIPAGQRSEVLIGSVPSSAATVEARLDGSDALPTDDRAYAIVPSAGTAPALIVGPGDPYLENALALLPRVELYAVGEEGYEDALADGADDGTPFGLVVFDGVVPDEPPAVPALYVDPADDGPFGTVDGRIEAPTIAAADADEPLLRFVDLSTVHVGRARDIEAAEGMRTLVSTGAGSPLVAVGEDAGRRLGLIGFDLAESDLPLQVAFPLLMSNLVDYLVPEAEGLLPSSMRLGQAATVRVPDDVVRVRIVTTGDPELVGGTETSVELPVVGGAVTVPGRLARRHPSAGRGQRRPGTRRLGPGPDRRESVQRGRVRRRARGWPADRGDGSRCPPTTIGPGNRHEPSGGGRWWSRRWPCWPSSG